MRCCYTSLAITALIATNASADAFVASPFTSTTKKTLPRSSNSQSAVTPTTPKKRSSKVQMSSATTVDAGGDQASGGTASIPNEIFNLAKSIVGAGVLSLPAGVAAFGDAPSAIVPAAILIASIGGISGYCFSLIGRVCAYTGASSYREAWDRSLGESTSIIPAASCTFMTSFANLAYSMILADTFQSLFATAGIALSRRNTLLGVTGLVLLPLCLLKNLSSLAPFSLLGIIGMAFTASAMAVRYLMGAYKIPSGRFLPEVAASLQPSFGSAGASAVFNPKSFILISMLSTAYMAHFNAPKFYTELKDNTIKRYNTVVGTSFALSIITFIAITAMGFLTFGANASGLILNNYANTDILASLSRIAVAISIVFSYPLAFVGVRDGVMDLAKVPQESRTNGNLNKLTVGLLSFITFLALKVSDLSFVLSFGGATLGNALIYIYPTLMFRSAVKKMGDKATPSLKGEAKLGLGVAALGVVMGAIGAGMAIKSL